MRHAESFSPEFVAHRLAIQDLVHRWCRAVDRLDFDAMRSVFHPDATDNHNHYHGNVEGLLAWIRERHQGITFSMHMVGNLVIEFASPALALAESYVWCLQRYPPGAASSLAQLTGGATGAEGQAMDLMACSRYVDRMERRGDEWKIAQRVVITDWKAIQPCAADAPVPRPTWNIGRHDMGDPLFRLRRELGLA